LDRRLAGGNSLGDGDELEHVAALLAFEAVEEPLARRYDERALIAGFAQVACAAPRIAVLLGRQVQESNDALDGGGLLDLLEIYGRC
jgi:hypothetical protein